MIFTLSTFIALLGTIFHSYIEEMYRLSRRIMQHGFLTFSRTIKKATSIRETEK